jgi:tRNA G46 methylase TrmB
MFFELTKVHVQADDFGLEAKLAQGLPNVALGGVAGFAAIRPEAWMNGDENSFAWHPSGLAKFTAASNICYKGGMRAFTSLSIPRPKIHFTMPLSAALDLEIGAGQGLHAVRYCQANPERVLMAVEKTSGKYARLEGRRRHHPELTNLHVIHADAVAFVRHYLSDRCLDRVFLLYPNPHPKARQANLRWHNRPFLSLLLQRMKEGAELTLATNMEWYAIEAKNTLCDRWGLDLIKEDLMTLPKARTHFEKKYLERGEACRNLVFRKPSGLPPAARVE